jgi:hypothetical protein
MSSRNSDSELFIRKINFIVLCLLSFLDCLKDCECVPVRVLKAFFKRVALLCVKSVSDIKLFVTFKRLLRLPLLVQFLLQKRTADSENPIKKRSIDRAQWNFYSISIFALLLLTLVDNLRLLWFFILTLLDNAALSCFILSFPMLSLLFSSHKCVACVYLSSTHMNNLYGCRCQHFALCQEALKSSKEHTETDYRCRETNIKALPSFLNGSHCVRRKFNMNDGNSHKWIL